MFTEYLSALYSSHCSNDSFSRLKRSFSMPSFRYFETLSSAICIATVPMMDVTAYSQMCSGNPAIGILIRSVRNSHTDRMISVTPIPMGISTIFRASYSICFLFLVPMQQTMTSSSVVSLLYGMCPGWYIIQRPMRSCISTSQFPTGSSICGDTAYSKNSTTTDM